MKGNLADDKLRALASSGARRSEATPELATVHEGGVADYDVVSWNALFAPSGTPQEIVTTLNAALREILADSGMRKQAKVQFEEAAKISPENPRVKNGLKKVRWLF